MMKPPSLRRLAAGLVRAAGGRAWPVVVVVAGAAATGVTESALLAIVAQCAVAITEGGGAVVVEAGTFTITSSITTLLLIGIGLSVLRVILQVIVAYVPLRIAADTQSRLRHRLVRSYLDSEWSVQAVDRNGHLQELVTAQTMQATQVVQATIATLSAGVMLFVLIGSAVAVSPTLAGAMIAFGVVLSMALRPLNARAKGQARLLSRAQSELAAEVADSVRMTEETQVFGADAAVQTRIGAHIDRASAQYLKTQFLGRMIRDSYQSVVLLALVVGLLVLASVGTTELASLGTVVLLLLRAGSYGQNLHGAFNTFHLMVPYLERVEEGARRYEERERIAGSAPFPREASIRFDRVSFCYGELSSPVLRDLTFSIPAGSSVGVIGPSGAGKSTLIQLLLRLRQPTEGLITVGGGAANEIRRQDWAGSVAYVPQEPRLIHGTIRDNIRYFRPDISDELIERAARRAQVHSAIVTMPDGYDTVVGRQADAVSGGQRQRICLARALVHQPRILILDEPTSALDLHAEAMVHETLSELRGSLTMLLVSHRLTTLAACDQVMVLVNGEIEALAPTAELMDRNPFFRGLVDLSDGARATAS